MIAKAGDVAGENGHCARLAAAPANDRPQFLNALAGFTLAAGQPGKQLAFGLGQPLAHGRD